MLSNGAFVMKHDRWLLLGLGLGLGGCASTREAFAPDRAPEYMVLRETSFFLRGPAQPGRPDKLPKQTIVRLRIKENGYSVVQLSDGRTGYVADEDLRLAPPQGRAVAESELYPERFADFAAADLPEPDLSLPVNDIPQQSSQ